MPWSPELYEADLSELGAGVSVVVVVNPPGKVVREYWDLIPQLVAADEPTEEQRARYFAVLSQLLVEVRRPNGITRLDTPEAISQFEDEDDPMILAVALVALWEERTRRREAAKARFRAPNG